MTPELKIKLLEVGVLPKDLTSEFQRHGLRSLGSDDCEALWKFRRSGDSSVAGHGSLDLLSLPGPALLSEVR